MIKRSDTFYHSNISLSIALSWFAIAGIVAMVASVKSHNVSGACMSSVVFSVAVGIIVGLVVVKE